MRTIVIVPAEGESEKDEYFANFVWRVRQAVKGDKLTARVVVASGEEGDSK